MKISTALLVLTAALAVTAAPAFAKNKQRNATTVREYLECDQTKDDALKIDSKDLSCFQRLSLHYCSIYDALPKDVQKSLSQEVYCNFIAEAGHGDEAQEAYMLQTAQAVGCFEGGNKRQSLLKKYAEKPEELDALKNFTRMLLDQEDQCNEKDKDAK